MFPWIIFGAIVSIILGAFLLKAYKVHKATNLLARLRQVDCSWDIDTLKSRLEEVRDRVMSAIEKGNIEPVRGLMAGTLYNRLKGKTAQQFGFAKVNDANIVFSTSKNLVDVEDYDDDSKDRLGLYVSYVSLASRDKGGPSDEFWVFVRKGDGWVLSDINPKAGVLDLASSRAYSELLIQSDNIAKLEAAGRVSHVPAAAEEDHEERAGRREYKTGRRDYR